MLHDRYCHTLHFDSSLCDLEKAETFMPNITRSCQSSWIDFGMLLRLGLMNLMFTLSCKIILKGEKPT